MNSKELQASVQYLAQKVKALLEHYKDQQAAMQQLKQENAQLKQQATKHGNTGHDFSNQPKTGTITVDEAQASAWKSSIDSYIRDIDKSIAYLEQLQ